MKKYIPLLALTIMLALPITSYAHSNQGQQGTQQQNKVQDPTTLPQGNQVQNQNQVETKNQGEESNLQVATQHMEQLMDVGGVNAETGQQIKTVAQEQIQAQTQIQNELNKLESRSGLMKRLFGPDYGAIKNLKQQMEQNELRIQLLTSLQNEVINQASETQLQEAIQALVEQNTALEEQIQAEEKVVSLFGWLIRLFNR